MSLWPDRTDVMLAEVGDFGKRKTGYGLAFFLLFAWWIQQPTTRLRRREVKRRTFCIQALACGFILMMSAFTGRAGTFRDDFEDRNTDGWQQFAPPGGEMLWKVIDGALEIARPGTSSTGIVTGEAYWADYVIEFDVLPVEHHGEGDIHLLARTQGFDQLLIFNVGDFCEPDGVCVHRIPGDKIVANAPIGALTPNEWHHLKLAAEGAEFTFWVNGEKVISYRDTDIKEGSVGFGVTNYTARFDNVVITGPDVPDFTPPTWEVEPRPVQPKGKLATTWATLKRK